MERFKGITIIILLAFAVLASAAQTKPASVLLQEGLYAEQIEGNLDAAIKIYEQVITQAKDAQEAVAQATYRIGMCYLKKGEQAKAASQFSNLVFKFPEQKAIVDKARKQLATLRSPTTVFEPVDELVKSGKVPCFEVQLSDNTALDLDSGEIALLKDEWPDRFDVAWDNDGGGVLMKKAGSGVRFLALPSVEKQRWDDAIYMARSEIDELRNSNARGIWARRGKWAAVLTNEANLAVIRIGGYNENRAMVYGWVEKIPAGVCCFGPVIERVVNDDGVGEDFLLDLDTGRLYSASDAKKWSETSGAAQEKSLEDFVMESGIDLFGETSKKSLMGIDMIAMPTHNERWNMSPEDVIEQVSLGKPGTPVALSADGKLPKIFVFKTGQGGMGILQITEMQDGKAPRHFKIRYKMLQEAEKTAPTEVLGLVMERVIHSEGTGEPFFFDLDTGRAFYPPPGLTRHSPGREVIEWSATKGIDFVNDRGRLELVEMTAVKVVSGLWDSAGPAEIRDALMKGSNQEIIPTHSKDYAISSPITYAFKTRENGLGLLQILEKKDENIRIRYKMLEERAKTVAVGWRNVFLPDADDVIQQGKVAVVLDLATGEMLPGNKDKQYFNKLNKGDVAYFDDEGKDILVCFRGAKITRKTANGKYSDTPDQTHTENTVHIYIIKRTPAEWTITTKEGDIYQLKVLSLDNNLAKIKYRKLPALEKKTSIDEKLRSAFVACGTLCDSIRNALDNDDFEAAEALCKEVEKHLAKGLELTPQSELGRMLESLAGQFKIWHEAIKAKDKKKAIRLGEALNQAGGLISDFILEEKPDTHK
jgi:tetratricopeptide (TPR) repeat protein